MSEWLDFRTNANLLRNSYIKGFLDISGGALYLRNDASINFYDKTDPIVPKMSLKSDTLRLYSGGTYTDVSTAKFAYIKDLTKNVQTSLTSLENSTLYIKSIGTNLTNLSGGLILASDLSMGGRLLVNNIDILSTIRQDISNLQAVVADLSAIVHK